MAEYRTGPQACPTLGSIRFRRPPRAAGRRRVGLSWPCCAPAGSARARCRLSCGRRAPAAPAAALAPLLPLLRVLRPRRLLVPALLHLRSRLHRPAAAAAAAAAGTREQTGIRRRPAGIGWSAVYAAAAHASPPATTPSNDSQATAPRRSCPRQPPRPRGCRRTGPAGQARCTTASPAGWTASALCAPRAG